MTSKNGYLKTGDLLKEVQIHINFSMTGQGILIQITTWTGLSIPLFNGIYWPTMITSSIFFL
jgi:hypothetical protein